MILWAMIALMTRRLTEPAHLSNTHSASAPDGKRLRRKVSGQTKQLVRDKLKAIHVELNIRPRPMIWSAGTWPRWCGRPRVMRVPSGAFSRADAEAAVRGR
jgi:hypothetical protein